ncbi:MAG: indolepyruvate ferredoxin oxidoreductase family protein [Alphaproteobacteria bacterium]
MSGAPISLDDKYALETGRAFMSGTQALVRLAIEQRRRDRLAGIKTAGFISGYRGSPLGGLDVALWGARPFLQSHDIVFQPGVNEDLAATAVWGSQQVGLFPGARFDGVFGIWYGKGPGVDRSGDVFRHANGAGTAQFGGVLALAGDDHVAKSSTTAHQSEYAFVSAGMPILNPAGIQDILDLGLYGFALSRFSGCWVGFKLVSHIVESSATVDVGADRIQPVEPASGAMPPGGLGIRWPDTPLDQEARLFDHKLAAARRFVGANGLDRLVIGGDRRRFGIIAAGKAYADLRQALADLGLSPRDCETLGLAVYKLGLTWPIESEGIRRFADGLDEILVVEEKRGLIEEQVATALFNMPASRRPRLVGKTDESGRALLPATGELTPGCIAHVVASRLEPMVGDEALRRRLSPPARTAVAAASDVTFRRVPYFCSGCPHNTSTKVPEGSRALAGIGCHYMALGMDRRTATFTQMGGEGASWIGQAPFTATPHVFQNIGDGTYYHSGVLAIRAAVAAGATMTYKILYNDAVAMTGGQHVDGPLTVALLCRQLLSEGVTQIAVVSESPDDRSLAASMPAGIPIHHRDKLDSVQRAFRDVAGVTAIVYDQTCAAEKRRRRKRGIMPDPPVRVFINDDVCEGCGDCNQASNCLSVIPIETEFGRKRAIDQTSCNKDFSCLKGFCPSFVTIEGGRPRRPSATAAPAIGAVLPDPTPALPDGRSYAILITGIGGTGVVTLGALLGMAAHLDGKRCSILDMTGLAQKGGAVLSHIQIADAEDRLHALQIGPGHADLLLGCDLVVSADAEVLATARQGAAHAIVNTHESITGEQTRHPDLAFPGQALRRRIETEFGPDRADWIDANAAALRLFGDATFANTVLLGHACQKGLVPVSARSIEQAIRLNGVGVEQNLLAFGWGRRIAAGEPIPADRQRPGHPVHDSRRLSQDMAEAIARRATVLTASRNKAVAERYRALVKQARLAEARLGRTGLADAVALAYFKLLAYKDEYEVARLYADPDFLARVSAEFEGDYRLTFHLAPPLLARRDPATGQPAKRAFGPWMLAVFRILARLKVLRETPLDPFGRTAERRMERQLIAEYEAGLAQILAGLDHDNHAAAIEMASLPLRIRGFGHVKARTVEAARERQRALIAQFQPSKRQTAAAE